jgi:outer membrane biosynthesis protein TonB
VSDDLKKARRSLGDGRVDEALLFLWNALEPARLEGGRALRELERLAVAAGEQGEESQRDEAQRLLATLHDVRAEDDAVEVVTVPKPEPTEDADVRPVEAPRAPEAEPEPEPEAEPEPETRARRNLGRYALPAIFLLIVLVNLLARVLGGD